MTVWLTPPALQQEKSERHSQQNMRIAAPEDRRNATA